jgi:hypothetical protein
MKPHEGRSVELYEYLLSTGSPRAIQSAHEAAFAKLSPDDLELLRRRLEEAAPPAERPAGNDPNELARIATDLELASPGKLATVLDAPSATEQGQTLMQTIADNVPRRIESLTAFHEWSENVDDDVFE